MNPTSSHRLDSAALTEGLETRRVGRKILVFPELDSTNTYALHTLTQREGPAADGTVIFAERQSAGRGRLGRAWHSPAGASLMFTTLLHEPDNVTRAAFWTMAAALAVVRGLSNATDLSPLIRWPNDIYVGQRKLAGILVEARVVSATNGDPQNQAPRVETSPNRAWLAIGIGLNCLQHANHFPPDLRHKATSLEIESAGPIDRLAIARSLLRQLDHLFADPSAISESELATEWCRHSGDIGQRVTLISNGNETTGRILDVHPSEGLLLQLDTGAREHFNPATTSRAVQ